jgi:hypothetical protein
MEKGRGDGERDSSNIYTITFGKLEKIERIEVTVKS